MPAGWGKKLTLIFAPADINKRDLGFISTWYPERVLLPAKPNYERSKKVLDYIVHADGHAQPVVYY